MTNNTDQPVVGYRSPPQHARFKKGSSGNPSGRRKAKPKLDVIDTITRVMSEPIELVKRGKPRSVTRFEALLHKTMEAALKGDAAARRDLIKLMGMLPPATEAEAGDMSREEEEQLVARFLARERPTGGCDA